MTWIEELEPSDTVIINNRYPLKFAFIDTVIRLKPKQIVCKRGTYWKATGIEVRYRDTVIKEKM
ncbi:MAG: hypothetical protein ACP5I8_17350 [Phycisphaerae bacterium]